MGWDGKRHVHYPCWLPDENTTTDVFSPFRGVFRRVCLVQTELWIPSYGQRADSHSLRPWSGISTDGERELSLRSRKLEGLIYLGSLSLCSTRPSPSRLYKRDMLYVAHSHRNGSTAATTPSLRYSQKFSCVHRSSPLRAKP